MERSVNSIVIHPVYVWVFMMGVEDWQTMHIGQKEYELSKVQKKIGKDVEEKVKTVQRKYMLMV